MTMEERLLHLGKIIAEQELAMAANKQAFKKELARLKTEIGILKAGIKDLRVVTVGQEKRINQLEYRRGQLREILERHCKKGATVDVSVLVEDLFVEVSG